MWRFSSGLIACGVAIMLFSSGGVANVCQHGWTYENRWVSSVNVLGVGTGRKITSDTTCIEIRTSGSVPYSGYHPTSSGWYADAQWLTDSTTTCDNPFFGPRYEMATEGHYDSDGQVFCKYCNYDDD